MRSIVECYDSLPEMLQRYIVSFVYIDVSHNIVNLFKFKKQLLLSTRLTNKVNFISNYKYSIYILFTPSMKKIIPIFEIFNYAR